MNALDAFFESYYCLRPVNATFTGIHDHDHRLPDWSPDGLAAARGEMQALRASLETPAGAAGGSERWRGRPEARPQSGASEDWPADDVADLRASASRDRALAAAFLDVQLAEDESMHFARGNPSL